MSNPLESKPSEIIHSTEEDLVRLLLDDKGIDNPDAKEALLKLVSKYEQEANDKAMTNPDNAEVSNRANIVCAIKVAQIYLNTTRYREEGLNSLGDALEMASQREETRDLYIFILRLLE
ncbi:MAG: hypothetical protein JWP09_191 [Candidatus Taylorbacteria bacterium]|nr:hypothetical protein [Candidatus Taylorbacteria bacterium]